MMYLKNIFKHFLTICRHKKAVLYFGIRLGIGWRAFFHDFSKFSPLEFFESVKYYNGSRSPIDVCKEINGYSKAWMHHKGRNPHHYEYWVDNLDNGGTPIDMPYKYKIELLCDYLAAGYTYSKGKCTFRDEYNWWLNKSSKPLLMHQNTKKFLTETFQFLDRCFSNQTLKSLNSLYWKIIQDQIDLIIKS